MIINLNSETPCRNCKKPIDIEKATVEEIGKRKYYFCSQDCMILHYKDIEAFF